MANEPNTSAAPATGAAAPVPAAPAPVADSAAAPLPAADTSSTTNTTPSAPVADTNPVTSFLDSGAPAPAIETQTATADTAPLSPDKTPEAAPAKAAEPAKTPEPQKPAEGAKQPDATKDEGNKSAEPAPLPVYEAWKLPDNVKLDETQATDFNKLLGEFQNNTKAEQVSVQKFGQEMLDRHVNALNEGFTRLHKAYSDAWQTQTDGWRESFINDPEIGGKRQETTIRLANEFIDTHGGTPENKAAFREVMKNTGLGVHPEVLRLLANAMNGYREGRPVPANPPRVAQPSKTQRWYGKKTG
jgi:hypothetical protein